MSEYEIWKDVLGYGGLYQVSNRGRVKSLHPNRKQNKLMDLLENERGYYRVHLTKGNSQNFKMVHRLVTEAFLDNPLNLPQVNHKDENKKNNYVENLEWCTNLDNQRHGTVIHRRAEAVKKPILQCDAGGNVLKEWDSAISVHRELGYSTGYLCDALKGRHERAYGYVWKYNECEQSCSFFESEVVFQ